MTKNIGKSIRLSGYSVCNTNNQNEYLNKKYDEEVEPNNENVFLEIYLEKQEHLPMGISQTRVTGQQPSALGN